MDANTIMTLAIAGIVGTFFVKDFVKRLFPTNNAPRNITPETLQQATPDAPLATRAWLDYVNNQPDQVPHLAIVGNSGAGKSTMATAVLQDRKGQIVVITAKEGDSYGGLDYIGIDHDATYTTANNTFAALDQELKRRLIAVKNRSMTADWLTVVLDDYSTLRKVCDAADDPFKLIARLGRSLRVRLILVSDSDQVKAWGIEGEGSTRQHFAFIRLNRERKGTLDIDDQVVPIDTSLVHQLALRAQLASRGWIIPRDHDTELTALLDIQTNTPLVNIAPQTQTNKQTNVKTREETIRFLRDEQGMSVSEIRQIVKGDYTWIGDIYNEVISEKGHAY